MSAKAGPQIAGRASLSDLALDRPVMIGMLLLAILVLGAIATARLPLAFLPAGGTARVSLRINLQRTSPELVEREIIRPVEEAMAGLRGLQRIQVGSGGWGVRVNLEFVAGTDIAARKAEIRERFDRIRGTLPDAITRVTLDSWGRSDDAVVKLRLASDSDLTRSYDLIERHVVRPIERIPGVSRVELEGVEPRELEVALDLEALRRAGVSAQAVSTAVREARQGRSLGVLREDATQPGVRAPPVDADPQAFAALPVARSRGAPGAASAATTAPRTSSTAAASTASTAASSSMSSGTSATTAPAVSATAPLAAQGPQGIGARSNTASVGPGVYTSTPVGAGVAPATASAVGQTSTTVPARVGEVARVEVHPRENRNFRSLDGRLGVDLSVYADAGASPVDVARAVNGVVEELQASPRLGGISAVVYHDQGKIILKTLADLRDTGIYGGLLGVAMLWLFLRRWGVTLVAALCIPLTILATCGVLLIRGEELNCIVLLGLVLGVGMLVDNAVVITEAIELQAQRGLPARAAVRAGGREVGLATVASTVSSVIVFLPLVFGDPANPMSALLAPLGLTFATVLLCSLFVSQTLVPLVMPAVLKRGGVAEGTGRSGRLLGPLIAGYGRLIALTLRFRRTALVLGLGLAASAVIPSQRLTYNLSDIDPKPDWVEVSMQFVGSPGYKEIGERVRVVEEAILAKKDALAVTHVSCAYSDFWGRCDVHPIARAASEADAEAFTKTVKQALPEQPGVRYLVGENNRGQMRGNPDRHEVELAIKGEDMGVLMDLAEKAAAHLRATLPRGSADNPESGGVDTVIGPYDEGSRELHVKLDGALLRRYGLRADDVARLIQTAFQGTPLGQVRSPEGQIELRLSAGNRAGGAGDGPTLEELRDLPIPLADGGEVTVGGIAALEPTRSPFFIQRLDRETQVKVKARFFTPEPEKNRELVKKAMESFVFPAGYSSGEWSRWGRAQRSNIEVLIDLGLCLLLVYAVMASLFESFLQPFAILATCLLGCVGAPWLMWWTGTTVDTTAMIGLFILIGIAVNNGIMLIDRAIQLRAAGMTRDAALAAAGADRLRPILMTAGTTVLGLVPMLIHHPTLAGVYYHAIALILVGGLASSTVMTLVFLPATYSLIDDLARAGRSVWRRVAR
ncbi:Multidrug efflux pump subunit AcrB [Nannocystis exedens]|uniref:Multidrug efflux pump subunit AcrB n=1 Tax=Nannocystis exedens TaxID=54 RepID=A0A1I1SVU5_9BACT|nr:efflux RND transporter permease subunit [Nannocystis exedens]PCC66951.1 acriflavin resistance protein [Nannocystis exedens]SFD50619.1 Multidrug efflux pump subunit AcrB [Nannocystis exedens]